MPVHIKKKIVSRVQAAKSLLSRGTGFSGVRNPLKDKPVTVEPCETVHHFKQVTYTTLQRKDIFYINS